MLVAPDTTLTIAANEAVTLELDTDAAITAVRVLPRFGDSQLIDCADGHFSFPLSLSAPNYVDIEWLVSGSSVAAYKTSANVVSRHYCSISDIMNYGDGRDIFDTLPEETLWASRQAAEEVFEQAAGRSFVPRIGRTKDYGRDELLTLEHCDVTEVLTDGYTQVSGTQLECQHQGAYPRFVEYIYGRDSIPAEVSRAVLTLATYTLRPSNRPIGATGESSEAGYIHFTIAGRDGATSIPEVNAAIEAFGFGGHLAW
jgi:hypothetical protein